ncbi:unnamed protein product [Penicillium nalgiovense]|nr:unnamed protein product [Penicillium nalgiovense]
MSNPFFLLPPGEISPPPPPPHPREDASPRCISIAAHVVILHNYSPSSFVSAYMRRMVFPQHPVPFKTCFVRG